MADIRVGIGHDTHRLGPGRPLVIGGVSIPHATGPIAHSDGDVLLHALIDALLGAAGLGDIGGWFPDTAAEWRDADSSQLVLQVLPALRRSGWQVGNVDAIIFAERPKLEPFKPQIRARIAELLGIADSRVNIKAKTGEKVGPIGQEEAIAAEVAVLLMGGESPAAAATHTSGG